MSDAMTHERHVAVERLQALPASEQVGIDTQINACLTRLERLCGTVREGLDSGPVTPLDMDAVTFRERGS
ncbi:MAG: hypothetical protein AAGG50_02430 [Bacteroidota bacterium]